MRETASLRRRRVCVFCGSSEGAQTAYRAAAAELGRTLARAGLGVVYGGARVGLMGALADAALAAGGEVIGVIPRGLAAREIAHDGLSRLYVVETMHERKARMAQQSDAFVALPGGYGTLEELFEAVTWTQLGIHAKPCLMMNTQGYFDALLRFLDHAMREGFIQGRHRGAIRVASDARETLRMLGRMFSEEG